MNHYWSREQGKLCLSVISVSLEKGNYTLGTQDNLCFQITWNERDQERAPTMHQSTHGNTTFWDSNKEAVSSLWPNAINSTVLNICTPLNSLLTRPLRRTPRITKKDDAKRKRFNYHECSDKPWLFLQYPTWCKIFCKILRDTVG